jgi:hypothetical protein
LVQDPFRDISNTMHKDPGNMLTVKIMIALCVILHFVVIPIWMYSLGLH